MAACVHLTLSDEVGCPLIKLFRFSQSQERSMGLDDHPIHPLKAPSFMRSKMVRIWLAPVTSPLRVKV